MPEINMWHIVFVFHIIVSYRKTEIDEKMCTNVTYDFKTNPGFFLYQLILALYIPETLHYTIFTCKLRISKINCKNLKDAMMARI